ncbi:MAG: hypothetical protein QNJ97_27790 [Myxococcota bacterium]|nr:hypothetical protein [Myxococcota bacterium]
MPPKIGSRYMFCKGVKDAQGRLHLTDREPYHYRSHRDNRIHMVVEGDTLFGLAGKYFAPLERACGYWWVIADFQPDPIFDPTVALVHGRQIHIPSVRVLSDVILSERRRRQY